VSSYDEAERAREEAEAAREAREDRRRIAEGGPDQHVPGNVALYGRVEAEADRQRSARVMYQRVAVLIALPLALVALIPSVVGLVLLGREIEHRCGDAAVNRVAIRASVIDSLHSLGYQYTDDGEIVAAGRPLDYYVTHPEERAEALAQTKAALERFPPIKCKIDIP